jgi:transcriptional regulator with XRE-family HTH domain
MRGDRLKAIREKRGLTQRELAERCGFNEKQILRYEKGLSEPTADHLTSIAQELSVSADYLLGLVSEPDQRMTEEDLSPMERKLLVAIRQGLIVEALETFTAITKEQN